MYSRTEMMNTIMSNNSTCNSTIVNSTVATNPIMDNKKLVNEMNDELRRYTLLVVILVGIETVLGFVGNVCVIFVFLFKYHVCNFRYFVLCLAFVDLLSTFTTMPGEMVTQLHWYVYEWNCYCKFKSFFNVFTVTAEALCLFTIAVDRYMKICHPFKKQIEPRVAKALCLVIYIVAFALALPVAFMWGVHMEADSYNSTTVNVTVCEVDKAFHDNETMSVYPKAYTYTLAGIISIFLVLMLLLYILVAQRLVNRRMIKRRSMKILAKTSAAPNMKSSDSNDDQRISNDTNASNTDLPTLSEITDQSITVSSSKADASPTGITLDSVTDNRVKTLTRRRNDYSAAPLPSQRKQRAAQVRRKTLIMFILTVIFVCTTFTYFGLLIGIANKILQKLTTLEKAVYFFFFRIVFINHVINPFIYGKLDEQFRMGLRDVNRNMMRSIRK